MNLTISYNSWNRKTTVHQNSALVFAGYSQKKRCKQEWRLFTAAGEEFAFFQLQSKLFSYQAVIKAEIKSSEQVIALIIQYSTRRLSYSLSFSYEGMQYEVHPHLADRFSIFRQQVQVASLRRVDFSNFTSRWILLADNALNPTLLVCLAYALFVSTDKHFDPWGDSPSNYWIKEAVPLNANWQPS